MINKKSVFLFLLILVVGFCFSATAEAGPRHSDIVVPDFYQAPMLSEMVAEGEIEELENRLPENPVVVEPYEEIGEYGGTWRAVWEDMGMWEQKRTHVESVGLLRQRRGYTGDIEKDIVEEWEMSEDKTEFTFHLREGIKWSDGEPFTTEDIEFYYEHVLKNETLTPAFPSMMQAGGEPAELEVIDDYTFKFSFVESYGFFPTMLTSRENQFHFQFHPKHYMKNYHPDFTTEEELDERLEEAGLDDWAMLYEQQEMTHISPDTPRLGPWVPKEEMTDEGLQIWERNPYYYKVDTEGNQLPYIDEVRFDYIPDIEVLTMEAIAGSIDYFVLSLRARHFPTLAEHQEEGDYRVVPHLNAKPGQISLFLNMTTTNEPLKDIFNEFEFRKAVSHAINREEVIDIEFHGLAEPGQACYPPQDPAYDEEWHKSYIDYNPELSNELLDELGLDERDDEGYRLRPDGERLEIVLDYLAGNHEDAIELIAEYLEDVGIQIHLNPSDFSLYYERASSNDVEMTSWSQQMGFFMPFEILPDAPWRSWGVAWEDWWVTDGEEGQEPPAEVKELFDVYEKIEGADSDEERLEYLAEAAELHKNNLFTIGVAGMDPRPGVAHERMRNILDGDEAPPWGVNVDPPGGTSYPEQFYIIQDYEL